MYMKNQQAKVNARSELMKSVPDWKQVGTAVSLMHKLMIYPGNGHVGSIVITVAYRQIIAYAHHYISLNTGICRIFATLLGLSPGFPQ